jgi:HSP20 family protein
LLLAFLVFYIQINFNNGSLTISSVENSSENTAEKVEKVENYTKREFSYYEFNRSFTLPDIADIEKISAKY